MCITAAASIDLKAHEPGLLEFCRIHGWPVQFYSAAQLQNAPGQFTPSAFVRSVTGVDNVCERAAVLAAGGTIILPKQAGGGVTFAPVSYTHLDVYKRQVPGRAPASFWASASPFSVKAR